MGLDTSKAQLLDDLRAEQAGWEALLAEIGEARMDEPGVAADWTIKDIVAHLTGWRKRTVARFQAALRHAPSPAPEWPPELQTDDEINAWIYNATHTQSAAQVLSDSRAVFDQLVETLDGFTDEELHDAARFPWLADETWNGHAFFDHFHEEHEPDMRAWLARQGQARP